MKYIAKNNKKVRFSKIESNDFENLHIYLTQLSDESKARFGPHSFDLQAIIKFYTETNEKFGFIAKVENSNEIIAYSTIKKGYIKADFERYESYNILFDTLTYCTFAPSVADDWQRMGIGDAMFKFILQKLQDTNFKHIVLWGGVQLTNKKAVNYYQKNGFKIYGQFNNGIDNLDMMLSL
jgi:diamine N-acetyltransferase